MTTASKVRRAPVTMARLAMTDHYRAQVNADQKLVALAYNPMADFFPREGVALIRNELAEAVNAVYRRHFQVAVTRPEFRQFLNQWMIANVANDGAREVARNLWRELDALR